MKFYEYHKALWFLLKSINKHTFRSFTAKGGAENKSICPFVSILNFIVNSRTLEQEILFGYSISIYLFTYLCSCKKKKNKCNKPRKTDNLTSHTRYYSEHGVYLVS